MSKSGKGMSLEIYNHIRENLHLLKLDLVNGKILNRNSNSLRQGYLALRLKGRLVDQHQVFAVAGWGELCIGMTVNHVDENRINNSWDNLELLTHSENISIRSSGHGRSKQSVKAIHLDTGEEFIFESQKEAGRMLGLNQGNINGVLLGERKRVGRYTFEVAETRANNTLP
ncbi:TPA: HNH endonuclease [Bacillus cereus]|nr:HNH endonuclease [Bacillus cereus]